MALSENERIQAVDILAGWYEIAEQNIRNENYAGLLDVIGEGADVVRRLSQTKHATRGVALTLCLCQILHPELDVRYHKTNLDSNAEGYSARGVDNAATVPFLTEKGLYHNVESHWLTRTMAVDTPYLPDTVLKTVPKNAGPDLIIVANLIYNAQRDFEKVNAIAKVLLMGLIHERNMGQIPLTRPKNLSIDQVMFLLHKHFETHYSKNAPRLPQIAIYAIYQCIVSSMKRYEDFTLMPLERMKAANRKSGSVGDIDLNKDKRPIEAVEIKYEIPIDKAIVIEATQKVQTEAVERYLILSTAAPKTEDLEEIQRIKESFLKSNGCEIIVNGVYDTIKYYLRLLKSTNDFINNYADLLSNDPDLNYEHKVAWNAVCEQL